MCRIRKVISRGANEGSISTLGSGGGDVFKSTFHIFFLVNFSHPQFKNEASLENMCGSTGARSSGFKAREQALCSRCHKPVPFTHFILVCD